MKNEILYFVKLGTFIRAKWVNIDKLKQYKKQIKLYDNFIKELSMNNEETYTSSKNFIIFTKYPEPNSRVTSTQKKIQLSKSLQKYNTSDSKGLEQQEVVFNPALSSSLNNNSSNNINM